MGEGKYFTFECEHEWYWVEKANSEYCYKCKQFNPRIMTIEQKKDELIKRFGQKFFNELGERCVLQQRLQGGKPRAFDKNALELANETVDAIWKEWVIDCEHKFEKLPGESSHFCNFCKSSKTDIVST